MSFILPQLLSRTSPFPELSSSFPLLPTSALLSPCPLSTPVPLPAHAFISPGTSPHPLPYLHGEMLLLSSLLLGWRSALQITQAQQAALCLEGLCSQARSPRWKLLITLAGAGAGVGWKGERRSFPFFQVLKTPSCLSASIFLQSVHNHVGLSSLLGRIGSPRSSWSPWTHCKYKNNRRSVASRGFNPLSLPNHAQIFFSPWQGSEQDDCYGGVWRERRLAGGLGGGGKPFLNRRAQVKGLLLVPSFLGESPL